MPGVACSPSSAQSTVALITQTCICQPMEDASSIPTVSPFWKAASQALPGKTHQPVRSKSTTARSSTLLNALQYLQVRVGGIVEPRRLSFRAPDIEQIGHDSEGLLHHAAKLAQTTILALTGTS